MSQVKICRDHRVLKRNGYCLKCKSIREKARYDADPDSQRRRKRNEYQTKITKRFTEQRMSPTQCGHDDALAVEETDKHPTWQGTTDQVYFCPDCGVFINDAGEIVDDPTEERSGEPQAGKAFRPLAMAQRATYNRNTTTKIRVKCSWHLCKETFLLYPQNLRERNWCPKLHRAIIKRDQGRARQEAFRIKHGARS